MTRADKRRGQRLRSVLFGTLALLSMTPPSLCGQTIVGQVVDDQTGAPIPITTVMLVDSAATAVAWAVSDSAGRFVFHAPRVGEFRLYAERLGYDEMISEVFRLAGGSPVAAELRMQPRPLELDSLVVTVEGRLGKLERQGFYRRRDRSSGYFFDAEDLERWRPTRLTDLIRQVPNVEVHRTRFGGTVLVSRRTLFTPCGGRMKVVLDGFKLDEASFDDWIDPSLVIGIEVYPGAGGIGGPVEHRGVDAACGIVMIWTR